MAEAADISSWMKKIVEQSGCRGIAVGLSGGIDSAVTSVLAQMAMGDNVLGVIMPCGSNPEDAEHALNCAKQFGIETEYIDLTPVFETLTSLLPDGSPLANANLKPRLRMMTLYYFANTLGYLVAGTGNKSELSIGYFTKYGDGGVDMLPLAGLLKIEVRELAEELEIPREIIDKPPSAGLWEGQTDENEMGFTYDELDRVIAKTEKGGFTPQTKVETMIVKMMERSEHKYRPIPKFEPE